VDGRNPAPVDRWFIPLFFGFQPSKVVLHGFYRTYPLEMEVLDGFMGKSLEYMGIPFLVI
jgi:hypothetical protein